ncbi:NADPH2:quinone reductase [Haloactinospora alba]|uniref:NADPH2:quinone reductase n=1 Tax=Haloactinospora alba TaxID=405555 RepID=A0A543N9E7_9ACTN|nr:zinc-binding dehydrogenase [Haloactinospora alba]TQN28454.1 NADPH2:quinone reductase [Haloactinospora alba]
MRAIQVHEFGGPEVLTPEQVPAPSPGPGEVVVETAAANVMYLDTQLRSGWGQEHFPVRPPYVPGNGAAGRVAVVGDGVDPAWVGTEVVTPTGTRDPGTGLAAVPTHGYAEQALAPADGLIPLPEGVDAHTALALLHDGPTAISVSEDARIEPGDRVLVTAATGGAGSLLVQLARNAGARVIGAARGERKRELARELGAEATVDYSSPDWVERVRGVSGGDGPSVVIDGAGGPLGRQAFDSVAAGGRFVTYGATGGEFADVDPAAAQRRGISVTTLFDLPRLDAAGKGKVTTRALEQAAAGHLRPVIGQTLDLERASEAHTALEQRSTVGKTLLVV